MPSIQLLARTFAVLAVLQIGWGALALVGRNRALALVGLVLSAGAVAGWILAKASGISFIDGLGEKEAIQLPDAMAAALAGVAAVVSARVMLRGASAPADTPEAGGRSADLAAPKPSLVFGVGTAVLVASLIGDGVSGQPHPRRRSRGFARGNRRARGHRRPRGN